MKLISRIIFTKILFISLFSSLFAQIPQVPAEMEFADLILRINPQARREIQLDVDALHRSPKHFQVKMDRFNLYRPIIEREFRAAGVPEDLKYLVIQESGLIADAVSTSNAVGFWQFKQGTAEEVSIRVDRQVDERKNIVNSSRGAALYLRGHNRTFDNWMVSLIAYQMGAGGAKAYFGDRYRGKRIVDVDRNSHWYFKKFLAHKVAFGEQVFQLTSNTNSLRLAEVKVNGPTSLDALAKKYKVSEEHLKEMNKWTSNGKIPAGGPYYLVFVTDDQVEFETGIEPKNPAKSNNAGKSSPKYSTANSYPRIAGNTTKASQPDQITVNNLDGVQAASTTTQDTFAEKIGIKEKRFRRWNDLEPGERVEAGEYYYTEKKKAKAEVATHIVQPGETLWSISQKYGIKLSSLKAKNRIRRDQDLKAGMVLNLQEHRKRGEDIPVVQISNPSKTVIAKNEQPVNQTKSNPVTSASSSQKATNSASLTHTVSPGETLYAISKKYGVTVDQLKSWNRIGSQNIISVGQKLTIFKP